MQKCIVFQILYFFIILWDQVNFCQLNPNLTQVELLEFMLGERLLLRLLLKDALCKKFIFLGFKLIHDFVGLS